MRTCIQHAVVRDLGRAWGVFFSDASIVMTLDGQTFRKFFCEEVSEDLLDNTEGIIVDELVCAGVQNAS